MYPKTFPTEEYDLGDVLLWMIDRPCIKRGSKLYVQIGERGHKIVWIVSNVFRAVILSPDYWYVEKDKRNEPTAYHRQSTMVSPGDMRLVTTAVCPKYKLLVSRETLQPAEASA